VLGELLPDLPDGAGEDPLDVVVLRRGQADEAGGGVALHHEDAVEDEGVEVDVEVEGSAEPLDEGHAAGPRIGRQGPGSAALRSDPG
jgi:hypothetical protein